MDIKVYRFINSHAMTQIIFLSKTFCNDFIKYIFNNINSNHEKYFHFTPNRNPFVQHAPIGIRLTSSPQMNKWVNYSPDLTTVLKNPAMGWMMYEEG